MNYHSLDEYMFPQVIVKEDEEYVTFFYSKSNKFFKGDLYVIGNLTYSFFDRIKKICPTLYWNCIHCTIIGFDDYLTEEYCINNHVLDIPYVNVSINDIRDAYLTVFHNYIEDTDGRLYSDAYYTNDLLYPIRTSDYCDMSYGTRIQISYIKIIMKRTKIKKREKRRGLSNTLRLNVLERDNYRCQFCGATVEDGVKLHIDHIIPVSKGGTDDMDNLQVLCHKCNLAKRDRVDLKCTRRRIGDLNGEDKEEYFY